MPLLYSQNYPNELLEINHHDSCMYVETHKQVGGGRHLVHIRNLVRGMPVTMREDYSKEGYFSMGTESRDLNLIDKEFKEILNKLRSMCIVCLPIIPFQAEIIHLEKHSPKTEKLVSDRISYIRETHG